VEYAPYRPLTPEAGVQITVGLQRDSMGYQFLITHFLICLSLCVLFPRESQTHRPSATYHFQRALCVSSHSLVMLNNKGRGRGRQFRVDKFY
jgi:hypothetical protein